MNHAAPPSTRMPGISPSAAGFTAAEIASSATPVSAPARPACFAPAAIGDAPFEAAARPPDPSATRRAREAIAPRGISRRLYRPEAQGSSAIHAALLDLERVRHLVPRRERPVRDVLLREPAREALALHGEELV